MVRCSGVGVTIGVTVAVLVRPGVSVANADAPAGRVAVGERTRGDKAARGVAPGNGRSAVSPKCRRQSP